MDGSPGWGTWLFGWLVVSYVYWFTGSCVYPSGFPGPAFYVFSFPYWSVAYHFWFGQLAEYAHVSGSHASYVLVAYL